MFSLAALPSMSRILSALEHTPVRLQLVHVTGAWKYVLHAVELHIASSSKHIRQAASAMYVYDIVRMLGRFICRECRNEYGLRVKMCISW